MMVDEASGEAAGLKRLAKAVPKSSTTTFMLVRREPPLSPYLLPGSLGVQEASGASVGMASQRHG